LNRNDKRNTSKKDKYKMITMFMLSESLIFNIRFNLFQISINNQG
jgi:heme/copper-type cytochrome/quinol oxidase subunit 3